jgi:hypothetical protein
VGSYPPTPVLRRAKSSSSNTNSSRPRASALSNGAASSPSGTTHSGSPAYVRRRSTSYGAAIPGSPREGHEGTRPENVRGGTERGTEGESATVVKEDKEQAQQRKRQEKASAVGTIRNNLCHVSLTTTCLLCSESEKTSEHASYCETGDLLCLPSLAPPFPVSSPSGIFSFIFVLTICDTMHTPGLVQRVGRGYGAKVLQQCTRVRGKAT